ncbi:hypothetical protein FD724_37155 (plasmid) [Nostoc sp. C057]|nr:hypothetical protein FD724_37155 [Nostoc sp. C057]
MTGFRNHHHRLNQIKSGLWTKIVCKLSAKDAHALLQRATLLKARVILVGDTRQLSAVSLD